MYLNDFIEEKYKSYDDVNLYYDGFLDYGENENLKDYINEFALYDKIKSISDELYFDYEIDNEFIKYRGRELNEYDNLNEFVYYNDIIINTYMYMWSVEEFNIDILKTYFTDGTFLLEGEYFLSYLKKIRGYLNARRSLREGSKGEEVLKNILDKYKIDYVREFSDGCINAETLRPLFYDFVIYINDKKIYVEVQGGQHYKPISFNGEGEEECITMFNKQKIRDSIKRKYAEDNGIFIELDYKEGNTDLLKKRINKVLIPLIKQLGGLKK